jgi:hypothetical protein
MKDNFKNSSVKVVGINNPAVPRPIKCLKIITHTKRKGIINIKYIFNVENHKFDKLFRNFDINSTSFIFEFEFKLIYL